MITSLRNSYTRLNDFEICKAIASGRIRGQWMDDEDYKNAELATEDTAEETLNKIDERRKYGYNYWKMFN